MLQIYAFCVILCASEVLIVSSVGDRIKELRQAKGYSAEDLGRLIGKDRATIYRYEASGYVKAPLQVIEQIAIALDTTPAYLMGWDDQASPETPVMTTFGGRLKELRSSRGWTQEQLAERLGTSKQVISRYESGLRSPKISVVAQWAEKLGVPLEQFAEDTMPLPPEQDSDIQIMSRAMVAMTPEERAKLIELGKVMFKEAFDK